MRNILVINLTILLGAAGCAEYSRHISSSESVECQRLKDLFNNLKKDDIETVLFFTKDSNEPVDEATLEEFEEGILYLAGCCFCKPHPLAKEWKEYKRLECVWENLEKESVQKIAFSRYSALEAADPLEEQHSPEDRHLWAGIVEPQKINEVLKLLREALKKGDDKFAHEAEIFSVSYRDQMQIVTDKHKYIIPVYFNREITYGIGWTSYKLRNKLVDWGFAKPMSEKEYRVLECVWENLEEENIQRIDFYQRVRRDKADPLYPSKEWRLWGEIIEPQKINKVLKLLRKALKKGDDRFVKEGFIDEKEKTFKMVQMQIVTDKQKYIIPIFFHREATYGTGWTSYELREKLRRWGFLAFHNWGCGVE